MNSQYFSQDAVASGELIEFIKLLTKQSYGDGDHYNDIHIKPEDCGAFTVEWEQLPWSHEYGGAGFTFIDEEHIVVLERLFPDNHYEICYNEADYKEKLAIWLKENPGYEQNEYGFWYYKPAQSVLVKENKPAEVHYENGIPQGE